MPFRRHTGVAVTAAAALCLAMFTGPAPGASSGTVIGATVPSATSIQTSNCGANVPGRTHFGVMQPGAAAVTTTDCVVGFGSSNSTSTLRLSQSDRRGLGMWQASKGALDASFDTDGKVVTVIAPGDNQWDFTQTVLVQTDGKIVTAGYCETNFSQEACLARYLPNGTLDSSFGTGGLVSTAGPVSVYLVWSAVLQPDGKIVTAGECNVGATGYDFCVTRYNSNGSKDTTFGTTGVVTTPIAPGSGYDSANGVLVQTDGMIVVVGTCNMGGAATGYDICAARYRSDGTLDTTFAGDGTVTTAVATTTGFDEAQAAVIQTDGKLVVAGSCRVGARDDVCVARYTIGGALDLTFGTGGSTTTATGSGGWDQAHAVALQSDGKIVTAGRCAMGAPTQNDACVHRYDANGFLDPTFDGDGRVSGASVSPINSWDEAFGVLIQADGRIVTAGNCSSDGATGADICLFRYNANGAPDESFGSGGQVRTPVAPGASLDIAHSVASTSDGGFVVAGVCDMGGLTDRDSCVVSYQSGGTVAQFQDGVADWDTPGMGHFAFCARTVTNATSPLSVNPTCPAVDGPHWLAAPAAQTAIASATTGETTANVALRFGLRIRLDQPPGSYVAPLNFDVIAP